MEAFILEIFWHDFTLLPHCLEANSYCAVTYHLLPQNNYHYVHVHSHQPIHLLLPTCTQLGLIWAEDCVNQARIWLPQSSEEELLKTVRREKVESQETVAGFKARRMNEWMNELKL